MRKAAHRQTLLREFEFKLSYVRTFSWSCAALGLIAKGRTPAVVSHIGGRVTRRRLYHTSAVEGTHLGVELELGVADGDHRVRPGGGGVHLRVRDESALLLGPPKISIFILAVVAAAASGRGSCSSACARAGGTAFRPNGDDGGGGLDALVDLAVAP